MLAATTNHAANAANTVVEGSATVAIMAFFSTAMREILPWLALCIPFIVLDLMYGIRAARHRGDKVRISTAIRRSVDKLVSYVMWVAAAVMLAQLFEVRWLEKAVLGLVYGNELISIIGNHLETKGVELSISDLWRLLVRKGAGKVGVDISAEEAEAIIKDKEEERKDESAGH